MKEVSIHQCLHGYSEGHRLLDSSIKLPDEVARLMLRMSDLSGGSVFPGFEEYLTGYPLASLNLYVLAKTWYAAEMPRPGCVWTHSLILQSKDMDALPSLDRLTKFFIRPNPSRSKAPMESGAYASSISYSSDAADDQPLLQETPLDTKLSVLVTALYYSKRRNLLIPAPSSATFEVPIMQLWSQQWPELRSNFSFCTGGLSSRGFAGRPFDVQCSPPQLIREITTSALAKQSQDMTVLLGDQIAIDRDWIHSTVSDAMKTGGGTFRKLLWSLADGNHLEDFEQYAGLVVRFLEERPISLHDLVVIVSERFPDKSSGTLLKQSLFNGGRSENLRFRFSELEILSELSLSDASAAFDSQALSIRARATQLCKDSASDAEQLMSKLFNGPINPLGEEVLAGLIEAVDPEVASRITAQRPHFLPALFRAKPELGTSAELWHAAGDHTRELFESLTTAGPLSEERITAIAEAILFGGAEVLITKALNAWGRPAVFGILNYVAASGRDLSERTKTALTFHIENVMEWVTLVERPVFAKVVCAVIVGPYSRQIRNFGTDIWLRTYEEIRRLNSDKEASYLASLLLSLGLQNTPPAPVQVIGLCFQYIHQLASEDKLADSSWVILDPIVPHLLWLHDWDKCERLRRGLVEAFVKFRWQRDLIHDCIKDDHLLSFVLQSARRVEGGNAWFQIGDLPRNK
jgi:hypothetical protein